jgi:hypothetical protein
MASNRPGATAPMEERDRIETRSQLETCSHALGQGAGLAAASLISYVLITHILTRVYSVSREDDLVGGMWVVGATIYVYRESYEKSMRAALSQFSATVLSFALCLVYLLIFPFHPIGMAALIGIGTVVLILVDRSEDVITAGITTTIVMVNAGIATQHAWTQPILRLVDTSVGLGVGIAAAWIGLKLGSQSHGRSPAVAR